MLAAGQHEQLVSFCSRSVVPLYKCTKEKGVSEPDLLDIMLIYMSASTQIYEVFDFESYNANGLVGKHANGLNFYNYLAS